MAEKILNLVPPGTHDWNKYIKPNEIIEYAEKHNYLLDKKSGLLPIPSVKNFNWIRTSTTCTNYILSLIN